MHKFPLKEFNVIIYNVNSNKFEKYNVIPYFVNCYKSQKKNKPVTYEEMKVFITSRSMYQFWARCQYEIILSDWPCGKTTHKLDVHEQIMNNIDLVTTIVISNLPKNKRDEINKTII